MKLKIALCDDDGAQLTYLSRLVAVWAEKAGHTADIRLFPSGEALLFTYSQEQDFDILLCDIEMPGVCGVDAAKEVRAQSETVQIVFITGYSDYIAEGYEVSALHYLLKPVNAEKLSEVLTRAAVKLKKDEKTVTLKLPGETVRLPLYEIRYIEAFGNKITVHGKSDYTVRLTLSEMENELDERFFRVGRSCILNLKSVSRIKRLSAVLYDGTEIPLPRGAYEALNRAIIALK